ncbi:hypothetical protein IW262DRAFT_1485127 [Armillaria fumosa]|nr:hypothetical protein IW262DRAFT_1485127 [Armillaria fumosa]
MTSSSIPRHPALENFNLLHSVLDETTPTITTLIGTNTYPSPLQYGCLCASRATVEHALHEIDIIMAHLEHARLQLLDVHKNHRSVMSPIRRLPAEILAEIFAAATTSFYPGWAVVLSRVCAEWRAVAIGCCPEMWNNMDISYKVAPKDPEALLRLVFSRCRDGPLYIRIGDIDNSIIAPLSIMMKESSRWRSFEVYRPNAELMGAFGTIRGNLDILESLSIRLSRVLYEGIITTFETAPSLKTVELNGQTAEMRIALPFSQLESYTDDSQPRRQGVSTAQYFLNILRKSPRLLKFHAGSCSWFPQRLIPVDPIVAPPFLHESLEELSSYDPALLRSVVLPALRIVKMESPNGVHVISMPLLALRELIVRSGCSLTSLTLRNISLGNQGSPHWRDVLDLTPCLTKLEVIMRHSFGSMYTVDFLSGLAKGLAEKGKSPEDPARYDIVPLLTDLTIEVADETRVMVFYSFLNADFVDMVASRYRQRSAALRHVRVVAKGNDSKQHVNFWAFGNSEFGQMRALKSEGLEICVFSESGWRGERVDCLALAEVVMCSVIIQR